MSGWIAITGCWSSGFRPVPSESTSVARDARERVREEVEEHEVEDRVPEQRRAHPRHERAVRAAREPDRGGGVRREHPEPEQHRAGLAAPERREAVGHAHGRRRVLRDVGELEVAGRERVEEHRHRERGEPEDQEDAALRDARPVEPAREARADAGGHADAGDERVRCGGRSSRARPPQVAGGALAARSFSAASNFDGHFARTFVATKRPSVGACPRPRPRRRP